MGSCAVHLARAATFEEGKGRGERPSEAGDDIDRAEVRVLLRRHQRAAETRL